MMLSNLTITQQKFVVFIDDLEQERIAHKFLNKLLNEQGELETSIKTLQISEHLRCEKSFEQFLSECNQKLENGKKWNVVLPSYTSLLIYQKPSVVIQFLNKLKRCNSVKRTFLWINPKGIIDKHSKYLVAVCEYIADMVVYLETESDLSILIRKPGGGVSNKHYTYKKTKSEFLVEQKKTSKKSQKPQDDEDNAKIDGGTFKIELDEEEMVARNAMKMPYEKATEATESNIIYTPDAADDFDEEDPDEDLNI